VAQASGLYQEIQTINRGSDETRTQQLTSLRLLRRPVPRSATADRESVTRSIPRIPTNLLDEPNHPKPSSKLRVADPRSGLKRELLQLL